MFFVQNQWHWGKNHVQYKCNKKTCCFFKGGPFVMLVGLLKCEPASPVRANRNLKLQIPPHNILDNMITSSHHNNLFLLNTFITNSISNSTYLHLHNSQTHLHLILNEKSYRATHCSKNTKSHFLLKRVTSNYC